MKSYNSSWNGKTEQTGTGMWVLTKKYERITVSLLKYMTRNTFKKYTSNVNIEQVKNNDAFELLVEEVERQVHQDTVP